MFVSSTGWSCGAGHTKVQAVAGQVAMVGAHADPTLSTGAGVRNGNLEVHLAGFGGKIGAVGIQYNWGNKCQK